MSEKIIKLEQLLNEYQELPEYQGIILQSVNQLGGFNSPPLHIAIYRENLDEVRTLLEAKADPNIAGEYGQRSLQVAVKCRNIEIIEHLLHAGAQCDLKDENGMDAWNYASILNFKNEFEEIVRRVSPSQLQRT